MASMRKLRRQLTRWVRYEAKVYGDQALHHHGRSRLIDRIDAEQQRRDQVLHVRYVPTCMNCYLPDPYRGRGDGIGSCECPRCQTCAAGPEECDCSTACWCGDEVCVGDCWDEQAPWPIETITVAGGVL